MRIRGIFRPADLAAPDDATAGDLAALFAALRPGDPDPTIDLGHAGIAVAAHNPRLALLLAELSRTIALETFAGVRTDLRELAIQTVNRRFGSDFSFEARRGAARAAGLSDAHLAALPDAAPPLFDAEQTLLVAYVSALVAGPIDDDRLVDQVKAVFGERATVELTTLVGVWSMWAMLLNAAAPSWQAA